MQLHTSHHYVLVLASFALAGAVQASCLADDPEIGDLGPDGSIVCAALERDFPGADIQLRERKFHSASDVVIVATVDDQPYAIEYRLVLADWVASDQPCLAGL